MFGAAFEIVQATLVDAGGDAFAVVVDGDGKFEVRGHGDGDRVCLGVPQNVAQALTKHRFGVGWIPAFTSVSIAPEN